MQIEKIAVKEQILKTVVKSGNGGAVWVPKDWRGREVIVILPKRQERGVNERIMHMLEPYLKDVMAVAIYGSYARDEQEKESDVDVLVITKDKDMRIKVKDERLDVIAMPIDKLKKAIRTQPIIYQQILREARPLINANLIEELRKMDFDRSMFKPYLRETEEHIKSNKEIIELDKIDYKYLKSFSALYSVMLRLRGLFIAECILKGKVFSNREFKRWLIKNGLKKQEFEDAYKGYRMVRDGRDYRNLKIGIYVVEKLLDILENKLRLLKDKVW